MELNLLEKTEVRITDIELENANLTDLAQTVADVMQLPRDKVLVVDVRNDHIALDILQRTVQAEQIFGKKGVLLAALAKLPGVRIKTSTDIHSDGILGYIGLDEAEAHVVLERTRSMVNNIMSQKRSKARVYPTGFEIIEGKIEDTNTPYIAKRMEEAGFIVEIGKAIHDSKEAIVQSLKEAASHCGVIITTGGVGAEDKDFTIEGILALDPEAATPFIVKFTKGQGRHVKEGVKVGVGEYNNSLLIALPGPHDEVKITVPLIIEALKNNYDKHRLAQMLVDALRHRLQEKAAHWHHH
ncbi:competence/damage-inducible protein A [Thermanaerosceptrum fracticalcis]|uniref:Competence/damage-inducible protein A n=1 Tax=Thermanaerosceptrum fracticalcis TaxID=1712410 RepID=A0A7G6E7P7_THEFR|nr:molybdopterin-binding protein [Thermanaerosceptrum fracticalcis]QNB48101.1 competence/damage-inducible protein A [Thermanaerosceptrum fracticalcis]